MQQDQNTIARGILLARAVAEATNLPNVRSATISGTHNGVASITVEFIPTVQILASICAELAPLCEVSKEE